MSMLVLSLSAALAAEPVPVHWTDVTLSRKVAPEYPIAALAALVEGRCLVRVTADEAGAVTAAKAEDCPPELAPAAEAAVAQWELSPAWIGGEPRAVTFAAPLTFTLPRYEWWRDEVRPLGIAWPPPLGAKGAPIPEGEPAFAVTAVRRPVPPAPRVRPSSGEYSCIARFYIDAAGVPYGGVVAGCPDVFAESLLRVMPDWRFEPAEEGAAMQPAEISLSVKMVMR